MKICLVGHYTERPDEGVRKLAFCLARELARRFEVMTLSISKPFSWGRARAFSPDIIHYILCPTTAGLAAAKFLSLLCPKAKTIVSAPQPAHLPRGKWMSFFKPNLILVQSYQSENMFRSLDYKTLFLPNGVDVEKFVPVTTEKKRELREKYGILSLVRLNSASKPWRPEEPKKRIFGTWSPNSNPDLGGYSTALLYIF